MGRASNRKRVQRPQYWHGGQPGLTVGTLLLPPSEHPIAANNYENAAVQNPWGYAARPDLVFITNSRDFARGYARNLLGPGDRPVGWVYRVVPLKPPQEDPDFAGRSVSFQCHRARIIAVEEVDLSRMTETDARSLIGPFMAWTDGTDVYDAEGYVLPDLGMRQFGYGREILAERFGQWPDIGEVSRVLTSEARRHQGP